MDILVFFLLIFSFVAALYGLWCVVHILDKLNKSTERISMALENLEKVSNRIQTKYTE